MVAAMKAKEAEKLSVLRGLLTLFTQELTTTKRTPQDTLSDEEVFALIRRSLKQRKEAAAQFRNGGREDLAAHEEAEIPVLEAYLPPEATEADIEKVVQAKVVELGVTGKADMGKLMGAVMKEFNGNADGTLVKSLVEKHLT